MIKSLIENNRDSIIKMIQKREKDNIKQSENYFLGEKIEIRMCDTKKTFFDGQTLYSNSKENIEKWYKKKCEIIFKEHLDNIFLEKLFLLVYIYLLFQSSILFLICLDCL